MSDLVLILMAAALAFGAMAVAQAVFRGFVIGRFMPTRRRDPS